MNSLNIGDRYSAACFWKAKINTRRISITIWAKLSWAKAGCNSFKFLVTQFSDHIRSELQNGIKIKIKPILIGKINGLVNALR